MPKCFLLIMLLLLNGCVIYKINQIEKNNYEKEEDLAFSTLLQTEKDLLNLGVNPNSSWALRSYIADFEKKYQYTYTAYRDVFQNRQNSIYRLYPITQQSITKHAANIENNQIIKDTNSPSAKKQNADVTNQKTDDNVVISVTLCSDILEPLTSNKKTVLIKERSFSPKTMYGIMVITYQDTKRLYSKYGIFNFVPAIFKSIYMPPLSVVVPFDFYGYTTCLPRS